MVAAAAPRAAFVLQDDVQGLVTGTLFAAFGVFLMQHAGLVPGGTVRGWPCCCTTRAG